MSYVIRGLVFFCFYLTTCFPIIVYLIRTPLLQSELLKTLNSSLLKTQKSLSVLEVSTVSIGADVTQMGVVLRQLGDTDKEAEKTVGVLGAGQVSVCVCVCVVLYIVYNVILCVYNVCVYIVYCCIIYCISVCV
jgi:hypothetical protein